MSEQQTVKENTVDPLEPWRELREVYMKVWAKSMGEYVNSEEYAQASGTMLESCLSVVSPVREAQKSLMLNALEQLNMPSQADFVSLAQRMTNIEMLLDDMAAKLDQIHQVATSGASRPTRESRSEMKAAAEVEPAQAKPAAEIKPAVEKPAVEKPAVENKPVAASKAATAKGTAEAKPTTSKMPKTGTKRSR